MWRSLLFVPILKNRLIEGAAMRGADAIVLDLEAAVPQDRKEEARAVLSGTVSDLKTAKADIAVRVNPLHLGGVDEIVVAIDAGADLIVLPQATNTAAKQAAENYASQPFEGKTGTAWEGAIQDAATAMPE
ncbi:MAG: aldolase/citrate lyase family protein, partial [Mangrovicoccus sp.]